MEATKLALLRTSLFATQLQLFQPHYLRENRQTPDFITPTLMGGI
jgi:hypothetical protein